jgi:hypothetical protein
MFRPAQWSPCVVPAKAARRLGKAKRAHLFRRSNNGGHSAKTRFAHPTLAVTVSHIPGISFSGPPEQSKGMEEIFGCHGFYFAVTAEIEVHPRVGISKNSHWVGNLGVDRDILASKDNVVPSEPQPPQVGIVFRNRTTRPENGRGLRAKIHLSFSFALRCRANACDKLFDRGHSGVCHQGCIRSQEKQPYKADNHKAYCKEPPHDLAFTKNSHIFRMHDFTHKIIFSPTF